MRVGSLGLVLQSPSIKGTDISVRSPTAQRPTAWDPPLLEVLVAIALRRHPPDRSRPLAAGGPAGQRIGARPPLQFYVPRI